MLGMKRILVPVDFSQDSRYAIEKALDVARENQGHLYVMHVIGETCTADRDAFPADPLYARPHPSIIGESESQIREMVRSAPDLVAKVHVSVGDPGEEILAWAHKINADVILLATHAHQGLKRYLLGSVADDIIRRSPCPVLVVHLPTEAHAAAPAVAP